MEPAAAQQCIYITSSCPWRLLWEFCQVNTLYIHSGDLWESLMSTSEHMAVPLKQLNCIIAANLFAFSTICFSSEPAHWHKLYQMHTSVGLPLSFNPVLARSQPLISGRRMVLFPRRETKLPKLTMLPWVILKPAKSMLKIQWRRWHLLLATGVFFKAHHHIVPSYFLSSRWHLLHRVSLKNHILW